MKKLIVASLAATLISTSLLAVEAVQKEEVVISVTGTSDAVITFGDWGDWATDTNLTVTTTSQTTYGSSVESNIQTIGRTTTTVVTTPQERSRTKTNTVTDTYSDNSTKERIIDTSTVTETRNNAVTTVTTPGSFTGRTDQVSQLSGLNVHRNLHIGVGLLGGQIDHSMANGYSATSNVISVGGHLVLDGGTLVGAGVNHVTTSMSATDSTTKATQTVLSAEASRHIHNYGITVKGKVNASGGDIKYNRTIGDFSAAGRVSNRDSWGTITVERSAGLFRPTVGVSSGSTGIDLFTETGDTEAIISYPAVSNSYSYGTLGVNISTGRITAMLSQDFGDSEAIRVGIGFDQRITPSIEFNVSANNTKDGSNSSTQVTAGVDLHF